MLCRLNVIQWRSCIWPHVYALSTLGLLQPLAWSANCAAVQSTVELWHVPSVAAVASDKPCIHPQTLITHEPEQRVMQ